MNDSTFEINVITLLIPLILMEFFLDYYCFNTTYTYGLVE